jgi:hypothetical protein
VKNWTTFDWLLAAVVIVLLLQGSGSMQGCGASAKVTAVVYVYEKDQSAIPPPVQAALNTINRDGRGIVATLHEVDATDGDDQIPDQYKVPVAAAKEVGLPALVVTAADKVLRTVKDPKTEADVLEAAK